MGDECVIHSIHSCGCQITVPRRLPPHFFVPPPPPPSPLRPLSPLRIPATSVERAIAVLCFIFGGCVYGYVIGAVCGVLSNQDPATQEYKNNMDLLNKYAEEEQLPHHLTVRCREYFM